MRRMDVDTARHMLIAWEAARDALESAGVVRTRNVVGDVGEWLVCRRLGYRRSELKIGPFDAETPAGLRVEVKARRRNAVKGTVFAGVEPEKFDQLVLVVFSDDWTVAWAARLGSQDAERLVLEGRLSLTADRLADPALEDITALLNGHESHK